MTTSARLLQGAASEELQRANPRRAPRVSGCGIHVAPDSAPLRSLVAAVADRWGVPRRALELQALMHLPRLASSDGFVQAGANREIGALAATLPPMTQWQGPLRGCRTETVQAGDLHFDIVDESVARLLCERFHYLHSHRPASRYWGLFLETGASLPVALAVVSPLDVPRLRALLPAAATPGSASVVTRVFTFDGAPYNTISRLLGRVLRTERGRGTSALVTYVNPSLGFSGTSYRAAGWSLLGEEPGTTYRYLDGRYATDRELVRRFGTADDNRLTTRLGDRYRRSRMPLAALKVFVRV